jgi:hypothetical protein
MGIRKNGRWEAQGARRRQRRHKGEIEVDRGRRRKKVKGNEEA